MYHPFVYTSSFVKYEASTTADFDKIDLTKLRIKPTYGDDFDYLVVELYAERGMLVEDGDDKYHQCQLIISRHFTTINNDGNHVKNEREVYRKYFRVIDHGFGLDPANGVQGNTINAAITKAAATIYHGVVDDLDRFYHDKVVFCNLRASAGVCDFLKGILTYSEREKFTFEEGGLAFDHADIEGDKVIVGYTLICCASKESDDYSTRVKEWVHHLAWRSDHGGIKVDAVTVTPVGYPYISISKLFEANKGTLKPILRIK